jgi:hypothetical protein
MLDKFHAYELIQGYGWPLLAIRIFFLKSSKNALIDNSFQAKNDFAQRAKWFFKRKMTLRKEYCWMPMKHDKKTDGLLTSSMRHPIFRTGSNPHRRGIVLPYGYLSGTWFWYRKSCCWACVP